MKRVLLDTNIYGRIIEELHENLIRGAVTSKALKGVLVIYGFDIIRKELRDTSKSIKTGTSKLRIALINLYDLLAENRGLSLTDEIEELAYSYYKLYKKISGIKNEEQIMNDFRIVACATFKNLDIIYSEDNKTMVSDKAIEAYRLVNEIKKLATPEFESYHNFIKEIRRLSS